MSSSSDSSAESRSGSDSHDAENDDEFYIQSLESVEGDDNDGDEDSLPGHYEAAVKLRPLEIMKLDISSLKRNKNLSSGKQSEAESIIDSIRRKRPFLADDNDEPTKKKPKLDTPDNLVQSSSAHRSNALDTVKQKELHFKPEIKEKNPFHLKCFLFQRRGNTTFTNALLKLLEQRSKKLLQKKMADKIINSYLFFFYRNLESGGEEPEIFVLSVGFARKLLDLQKLADKTFTGKIERRILQFPFQKVEYRKESGPVYKSTDVARPGLSILFDVWDFLDNIVGNRTRQLRENASLYSEGLGAFCSDTGEPLPVKVDVKEASLKINRSLTLAQMGSTLEHFSNISRGEKSYEYNVSSNSNDKTEEEDTQKIKMHDFYRKVTSRRRCKNLNQELRQFMERCMMGNEKTFIYLTHRDTNWNKAEKIIMYARKPNKKNRSNVKEWCYPPSLDNVLASLRETCGGFDPELLDNVQLKFCGKVKPLKDFIFTRFDLEGPYIYYFGTWLEMTAHYLYLIESSFSQLLPDRKIDAESIPLLPWKEVPSGRESPGYNTSQYKIPSFEFDQVKIRWEKHFETTFCDVENIMLNKLVQKDSKGMTLGDSILTINDNICGSSRCKAAARLYLLHECILTEGDYNASHALFDRILTNRKENMIVCDRIEPHGIELCDILIWDEKTTYLVHVKIGFNGNAIRAVCSQIRNAADQLYRELTTTKGTGILKAFWDILTSETQNGYYRVAARNKLQGMGYDKFKSLFKPPREIVFVLACRDVRKNSDFKEDFVKQSRRDFEVNMVKEITDNLSVNDTEAVVTKLKEEKYLTEDGNLTNKFIIEGKDNKTKFVKTVKQWSEIGNQTNPQKLFDVLASGLSKSKSTIAKTEIIRLCKDFKRGYFVGEKQFELKITSIEKQFIEKKKHKNNAGEDTKE